MTKFQDLYEFVDIAARNRKYPESTAQALKAALKLYSAELNDEESENIDKFKENFEQIVQSVFSKNKSNFTTTSLATYKSRVQKVLTDFERYSDPIKMNSWSPKVITRSKKKVSQASASDSDDNFVDAKNSSVTENNVHKIELALRPGVKMLLIVPRDLKELEAKMINSIVASLVKKDDSLNMPNG